MNDSIATDFLTAPRKLGATVCSCPLFPQDTPSSHAISQLEYWNKV